jgi:hypothetical protein
MGDPDEAGAARGARSDSEQTAALEKIYAMRQVRSDGMPIPVQQEISNSGFWFVPITIHCPILHYQPANCLHFALLDYRTCGEKSMLRWAEAYTKEPAFFILFLSFRPYVNREGNMKQQKRARFNKILGRFKDRCSLAFLDDNVISLYKLTVEVEGKDKNADLISNADGIKPLQHLLNRIVETVQSLRNEIFKAERKRCGCFGQVVESKKQTVVALALIGYDFEDTLLLRAAIAAMVRGTNLANLTLVTASVNAQGESHFSFGTLSLELQGGRSCMGDAWQEKRPVDYVMNIGQPHFGLRARSQTTVPLIRADAGSCSFSEGKPAAPSQTWAKADFSQLARKAIYDSWEVAWFSIVRKLFSRDQEAMTKLVSQMRAEKCRASVEKQNALAALDRKRARLGGVRPPPVQHAGQVVPNDGVGQRGSEETEGHNQTNRNKNQKKSERRKAAKRRQAAAAARRASEKNNPQIPLDLVCDRRFEEGAFAEGAFTRPAGLPETGMPETGQKTRPNIDEESDGCTQAVKLLAGEVQAGLWKACMIGSVEIKPCNTV